MNPIDPSATLALIVNLYSQLLAAQQRVAELEGLNGEKGDTAKPPPV